MSEVNYEDFTWFAPKPKNPLAITIPNPNTMNLNHKLMDEMPAYVMVGIGRKGDRLCLREQPFSGYKLPKSGSLRKKEFLEFIVATGVPLPAKYTVLKENDCWLAMLDEYTVSRVNTTTPSKRPKKNSLNKLLEEGNHNEQLNRK